jgi:hypothetical protein
MQNAYFVGGKWARRHPGIPLAPALSRAVAGINLPFRLIPSGKISIFLRQYFINPENPQGPIT